ncbi:hypothetical protein [Kitasatospora sp. NPDC086791]|uniref:hypothetical protein n=1 Tax=Kitasatospora sp. NPDC086791 TaxID=3155178 RepID=UPI003415064D
MQAADPTSTSQLITITRPLTVTTANGNPFTLTVGQQVTATLIPWWPGKAGLYQLSGCLVSPDGRQLRYFPGFEPTVRVDRLHRAVDHPEPMYRHCDRCHGTGRNLWAHSYGDRRSLDGPTCKNCAGTGHARTYGATTA